MSIAVIKTGGKQYVVTKGDKLSIEKIEKPKKGIEVIFDKVLLIDDGKVTDIGTPFIKGAKVSANFIEEGRGKKISVLKYKSKTRYHILRGHRQPFSKVEITKISKT